jgi:hypothetical protein
MWLVTSIVVTHFESLKPSYVERVKADNLHWLRENKIARLETNAIYAVGHKGA